MELDYSKPGPELMVDLINQANGTKFVVGDLTFSDVAAHSDVEHPAENTKVTATGTGTTRFKGPKDLFYTRLDLQPSLGGRNVTFSVPADVTLPAVLDMMNERYKLGFGTEDLEWSRSGPVIDTEEVDITAKPGSLTYIGTTKIILKPV
ncbi:hypothetical protein [Stenotrophomonas sp. GD03657]|uniref:DUF7941 domain-family protein n=1 Tax=Stenotrophomonas sp. GD03657 TaxID=2975363 RepID=UPI002448346A|nr:hypothetical protein [Stenotrophomonas sp. GD03657]MDH2154205.1 hypothetical protein [Stenotrophomonas sp. GD03657]